MKDKQTYCLVDGFNDWDITAVVKEEINDNYIVIKIIKQSRDDIFRIEEGWRVASHCFKKPTFKSNKFMEVLERGMLEIL